MGILVIALASGPLLANDEVVVERFLARLGLIDLQTRHLEQMVERAEAGDTRRELATRLADLYSAQLIERSENKTAYDQVMQRIQHLLARVPEAKSAALEVMLLQADYFRAENLMSKWIADRSDSAARDEAAEILTSIAPQLDTRQQQLHETMERLSNELDAATAPDIQNEKLQEFARVQAVAGRASFFAAWAHYYLGIARSTATRDDAAFVRARDLFRRILGIDGDYAELEAESLGLESIWRARTLVGLGLAEAAQGNIAGSRHCFELLDRSPAPAEVRELSSYWRLQGLLNGGHYQEALAFAEPQIAELTGSASQGRVSFCIALVRAAYGHGATRTAPQQKLGMLGITGLIKLRQQSAVRQLMEKYQIPVDPNSGFHLAWLHGQQLLDAAEKSKQDADYEAAAEALAAALAAPDAQSDLAGSSQCQYQLGWCLYQTEKYEQAVEIYRQAQEGLKATDSKTAAEAAWMQFICYQTLAKSDRKFVQSAIHVLRDLQRDFPEHPYAKRADYYVGKMQQAALPVTETIANLERVPPSSPDYLAARFEICQLLYGEWQKKGAERAMLEGRVRESVEAYLKAPGHDADLGRLVRVLLIGSDVALNGTEPDDTVASSYLMRASPFIQDLSPAIGAEYHYRGLQLATRQKDTAARREHADWIVRNGAGSPFELSALVVSAKALDDQLSSQSSTSAAELQEAEKLYKRLVEQLGDDPDTLKSKKNAQVALSRLAHYQAESGQHAEAAASLDKLLNVFPTNRTYLRRAGLAAYQAGEHAAAVERWRVLAAGLPDGSEEWYEAKYYQLATLARLDRSKAREAFAQFRLLYPELGPPAWRSRFAELQQQLE